MKIRLRDGTGIIDLKYLIEDVDRHGNVRVYFRRRGRKLRLRETPGTPEFLSEYHDAMEGAPNVQEKGVGVPVAKGSLRWLVERYYESAAIKELHESTRGRRRVILDAICEMHGAKPYTRMEARHVVALRDEKAAFPEAANERVKILRQVFVWAVANRFADANPARDVPRLKSNNPGGWHTWTEDEVRQYAARHPVGTKAHLALALFMFTGVRISDAAKLGRQMERDGWLHFTETKGQRRKPKDRDIPILPELRCAIDAAPSGHLTYLVTTFDKPFSTKGLGNWFRKRCDEAGLPHCSAHGLRKAGATIAADNGATEHQLMAMYGWESPKQAALYTRKANRKKLTGDAMHLVVPDQTGNKSVPLSEGVARSGTIRGEK